MAESNSNNIETITDESEKTVLMLIKQTTYNHVYSVNNQIIVNFLNQFLIFTVKLIQTKSSEHSKTLTEQFDSMRINHKDSSTEKYYLIKNKTKFRIIKKSLVSPCRIVPPKIGLGFAQIISEIDEVKNLALGLSKTNFKPSKTTRGVLLHGPSGCGKSLVLSLIASETESQTLVIQINTSEIFSKFYGESEGKLKQYFETAFSNFPSPTLIILDEIKNICPNPRGNSSDIIKRISSVFCTILDSLHTRLEGQNVFVIASTDNPDGLNPSIRRSGRLDFEIEIPVPNPNTRELILSKFLSEMSHNLTENDLKLIAKVTHGYVGSDLINLLNKAFLNSLQSGNEKPEVVTVNDVNVALTQVKPSAMREVLIESPNVKWTDIGGMDDLKLKLKQTIEWPINNPNIFIRLNIKPPRGLLMFGPPGCSKTLIAKALATESKLNFLSIKGSELFSMWVGESEKAVRKLFRKARQVSPSIIFFDEIDAIGSERISESVGGGGGTSVKERVLAQILTEIDGVNALNNVIIIAATNRPDLIDPALMRPGRIDRIIYVKLPDSQTRHEIFKIYLRKIPIDNEIDVENLVERTEGYSGAEIQAVCQEAALKGLEEDFNISVIKQNHFNYALDSVKPRTSRQLLELYENYLKQF